MYGPADATAISSSLASRRFTFLVSAHPACNGKAAVKWVYACLLSKVSTPEF